MKKTIVTFIIFLALVLGTAGVASAITNGVPDGDNHPYVGLLVFDVAPGTPGWRCSGALIAPNVVLTAGHCTDGAVAARFWADKDVTYDHFPFPLYPYGGPGSGSVEVQPTPTLIIESETLMVVATGCQHSPTAMWASSCLTSRSRIRDSPPYLLPGRWTR